MATRDSGGLGKVKIIYHDPHGRGSSLNSAIYCGDVQDLATCPIQINTLDVPILWKKSRKSDPFCSDPYKLLKVSWQADRTLQRLAQWVNPVAEHQYRIHTFQLLICGNIARFIRYDHAAAIVSESFDYIKHSGLLVQFFHRLAHLNQTELGRDERYTNISEADQQLVISLHEHFGSRKGGLVTPLVGISLTLKDEETNIDHEFLLWRPIRQKHSVLGRETRAFIVFHKASHTFKFYKESWQPDSRHSEATTLRMLNKAQVPHVPTLFLGGDIPGHVTKSQDFLDKPWNKNPSRSIYRRRNTYILINELGMPAEWFQSARQFLQVIRDGFVGKSQLLLSNRILSWH